MAAGMLVIPQWMPAVDADGEPIPGARISFFMNETTTLATIYSDKDLSVPLQNPVYADSAGKFPVVWADDAVTYTATVEAPYGPPGAPFTFTNLSASLDGAEQIVVDLEKKADRFPESAWSYLQSESDKAYADFIRIYWDEENSRIVPTKSEDGYNNGLPDPDAVVPSLWHAAQAINVLYERWKRTGDLDAKAKIADEWVYLKSVFTPTQLRNATSLTANISDDAVWQAGVLRQAHEATGDALALQYLIELIPDTTRRWRDPNQTQINHDFTTPGGIPFLSDPYGILYAELGSPLEAVFGYISSTYELGLAVEALYVYAQNPTQYAAYREYAESVYDWAFEHMRSPAPTGPEKGAQGIYFTEFNLDPDVVAPQQYLEPRNDYYGKPIRGLSTFFDGGTLFMAVLAAELYGVTGEEAYLAEARSIAAVYTSTQAFGRVVNNVPLIGNLRDPWTNAYPFSAFARKVLTLDGVDPNNRFRVALLNTSKAILSQKTPDGRLGGDWHGPEHNFLTGNSLWSQEAASGYGGRNGGGQGWSGQIMTHASSLTVVQAAQVVAMDVDTSTFGSGVTGPVSVESLASDLAAVKTLQESLPRADDASFTRPIRFAPDFYFGIWPGGPILAWENNVWYDYGGEGTSQGFREYIDGIEQRRTRRGGTDFFYDVNVVGRTFFRAGGDYQFYADKNPQGDPFLNFSPSDFQKYDQANDFHQFFIGLEERARIRSFGMDVFGDLAAGGIVYAGTQNDTDTLLGGYGKSRRVKFGPGLEVVGDRTTGAVYILRNGVSIFKVDGLGNVSAKGQFFPNANIELPNSTEINAVTPTFAPYSTTAASGTTPQVTFTVGGLTEPVTLRFQRSDQTLSGQVSSLVTITKNGAVVGSPLGTVGGAFREATGVVNGDVIGITASVTKNDGDGPATAEFNLDIINTTASYRVSRSRIKTTAGAVS